jgi:hypothetical protein
MSNKVCAICVSLGVVAPWFLIALGVLTSWVATSETSQYWGTVSYVLGFASMGAAAVYRHFNGLRHSSG